MGSDIRRFSSDFYESKKLFLTTTAAAVGIAGLSFGGAGPVSADAGYDSDNIDTAGFNGESTPTDPSRNSEKSGWEEEQEKRREEQRREQRQAVPAALEASSGSSDANSDVTQVSWTETIQSVDTPATYGATASRPPPEEPEIKASEIDVDNVIGPGVYRSPGVTAIVGTPGSDDIFIGPGEKDGSYQVELNGEMFALEAVDQENLLTVIGYTGSDTIIGSDLREMVVTIGDDSDGIDVGNGDDLVFAGGGNDLIFGRGGHDVIDGGSGQDQLDGGDGDDVVVGGDGDDIVRGGPGRDRLVGGPGSDLLEGNTGDDILSAGLGDDIGYGGKGADILYGHWGNDYLDGGPGADELLGMQGRDILSGGLDDDKLIGGPDDDTIVGGPGTDRILDRKFDADTIYTDGKDRGQTSGDDVVIESLIDLDLAKDQITFGDPEFIDEELADRVESDLVTLRALPTGKAILAYLEQGGRTVEIAETPSPRANSETRIPFSSEFSAIDQYPLPDGTPGTGVDSIVFYGTANAWDAPDDNVPVVEFGHELIHAARSANGTVDPGRSPEFDQDGNQVVIVEKDTGNRWLPKDAELEAVGLPFRHGDQDDNVPQSADLLDYPDLPITENGLRSDLRLPPRQFYEDGSLPIYSEHYDPDTSRLRPPTAPPDIARTATNEAELMVPELMVPELMVAESTVAESTVAESMVADVESTIDWSQNATNSSSPTGVDRSRDPNLDSIATDQDGQPEADEIESETPGLTPITVVRGTCEDSDGDGWGWDGQQSCTAPTASPRLPSCEHGFESDSDGDGFGWESGKPCVI